MKAIRFTCQGVCNKPRNYLWGGVILLILIFAPFAGATPSILPYNVTAHSLIVGHMPWDISAYPPIESGPIEFSPNNRIWFHVGDDPVTTTIEDVYDHDWCESCDAIYQYGNFHCAMGGTPFDWVRTIDWHTSPSGYFESEFPHGTSVEWFAIAPTDVPVNFSATIRDFDNDNPAGPFLFLDYTNSEDEDLTKTSPYGLKSYRVGLTLGVVCNISHTYQSWTVWEGAEYGVSFGRYLGVKEYEARGGYYLPLGSVKVDFDKIYSGTWTMRTEPMNADMGVSSIMAPIAAVDNGEGHVIAGFDNRTIGFDQFWVTIPYPKFPVTVNLEWLAGQQPYALVGVGYALGSDVLGWSNEITQSIASNGDARQKPIGTLDNGFTSLIGLSGSTKEAMYRIKGSLIVRADNEQSSARGAIGSDWTGQAYGDLYNEFRAGIPEWIPGNP